MTARRPTTLGAWAARLGGRLMRADAEREVIGLQDDSRRVTEGMLFFARQGADGDGRRFAADAVAKGALAVVAETGLEGDLPVIEVPDAGDALRRAADLFYDRPQDDLVLIGITGTKGKTTAAWLAAAALRAAGIPTAIFGTIAHDLGSAGRLEAQNTTPGLLELRRLLAEVRDAGLRAAVLEVSSHALDQGRVAGLAFRASVFTNLGRDHLDYHPDVDAYFDAKATLFEGLAGDQVAILNRDDERYGELLARTDAKIVSYGRHEDADLRIADLDVTGDGTAFRLVLPDGEALSIRTPMIGAHNAMNLAAAIAVAGAVGVESIETAGQGASELVGVPGRLERVGRDADLRVFVDYAHTEEALREVLQALRDVGARPLICVVGCGGDRDKGKRPLMARAAAELSDRAVLTSDNPRTEDPEAILADMVGGLDEGLRARTTIEADRRQAIQRAIHEAPVGASILIAGKGHEVHQVVGRDKIPFDDAEEAREALRLRIG